MPLSRRQRRRQNAAGPMIETLEERVLLTSAVALAASLRAPTIIYPLQVVHPVVKTTISHPIVSIKKSGTNKTASSSGPVGLLPSDIRHAYGIDQITFGSVVGDGTGQIIAIIDAYDDPSAFNDLNAFSSATGLPTLATYTGNNTTAYFRRVAQDGSTNYPTVDPASINNPGGGNSTWEQEESLDIEWAHAIAPNASIVLVEATNPNNSNLMTAAVGWARSQAGTQTQPGIDVISMSFGGPESSGDTSFDSLFTTPSGRNGVTFVASTGDEGAYGDFDNNSDMTKIPDYPATSPNVVAVGGTTLTLSNGNYSSESGWGSGTSSGLNGGSGGGISTVEAKPTYQSAVTQSATKRTIPDVSLDADPNSGVAVYDSFDFGTANPWVQFGGTSLSAPMFAALIAIADQGRNAIGLTSLDGVSQTLPAIYAAAGADFHDVTTGNNGFSAGAGYDLVTGRGSPVANLLIPAISGGGTVSGTVYSDNDDSSTLNLGDTPLAGVTVFLDTDGNGVLNNSSGTTTLSSTNVPLAIPDKIRNGANGTVTSNLTVSGLSAITNISITFNISHTFDQDLIGTLTAPSGTSITLFSRVGSSGDNFTNTTLSTSGAASIATGTAPFSGTFLPAPGTLTAFNGQTANGTWKFKLTDAANGDTGTLNSWSLSITSGNVEPSTVTDANGHYSFALPNGTYKVTEVLPMNYVATAPTSGNVTVASNTSTLSFGSFPTVFNAGGANDSFFVTLDPTNSSKLQIFSGSSASGTPAYTAPLTLLSSTPLVFNLLGSDNILSFDFTNGSPIPGANITVNATADSNEELRIIGGDPNTQFNMTDFQIGPTSGAPIVFNNLPTLTLSNGTFNYSGTLDTLQTLNIENQSTFIWN